MKRKVQQRDYNENAMNQKEPNKMAFLRAYARIGSVKLAAKCAKISRTSHWKWLQRDPDYVKAFEKAQQRANATLEDEAVRRAKYGTLKPVFHMGQQCGTIREYSDTLLIFLLKGNMPAKYRETRGFEASASVAAPNGGPEIRVTIRSVLDEVGDLPMIEE